MSNADHTHVRARQFDATWLTTCLLTSVACLLLQACSGRSHDDSGELADLRRQEAYTQLLRCRSYYAQKRHKIEQVMPSPTEICLALHDAIVAGKTPVNWRY